MVKLNNNDEMNGSTINVCLIWMTQKDAKTRSSKRLNFPPLIFVFSEGEHNNNNNIT